MAKRKFCNSTSHNDAPAQKRRRETKDNLLSFTDELLLKILTFLQLPDLIIVQRVSRRLRTLSNDNEVWKREYHRRWVKPRSERLGRREAVDFRSLSRSSKRLKWLDHGHLLRGDVAVDWKRQYKIRTNWWRGRCRAREVELALEATDNVNLSANPVLVRLVAGFVFTVDSANGLRAWSKSKHGLPLATHPFTRTHDPPTALGIDAVDKKRVSVVVGFADGSFETFIYASASGFRLAHSHPSSSHSAISAAAISYPYVLTMSEGRVMSLYRLSRNPAAISDTLCEILASLKSEVAYEPLSLSLRPGVDATHAAIAYTCCQLNRGWSVGLQEIRLVHEVEPKGSQSAVSRDSSSSVVSEPADDANFSSRAAFSKPFALHPQLRSRPASLSYSHPFLVAALADNTILSWLVTSDPRKLEIHTDRRLWGHTSAVSGATVDGRGKAVSVSAKGSEIRVWELEDIIGSNVQKRSSVRIDPVADITSLSGVNAQRDSLRGDARGIQDDSEPSVTRSCVDFDDEEVVVLGQCSDRQILSCYDFT